VKLPGLRWDDPRVMDSTDALALVDIPKRLLVIGGGIIGLEMACVFDALGSEVTVVELADQLMPGADLDLVKPLQTRLAKRYAGIHLKTKVTALDARKDGLHATFEGESMPKTTVFDRVLCAVGRTPNGKKLNAEAAGVNVDARGFIAVDNQANATLSSPFTLVFTLTQGTFDACYNDSALATKTYAGFVTYTCVVLPNGATPSVWSGTMNVGGISIGTGSGNDKICRYSADYDGSGGITNAEHPATYANVTESLENQNFMVMKGNASCPAGTVQHQP
jgi:hypothetical protein